MFEGAAAWGLLLVGVISGGVLLVHPSCRARPGAPLAGLLLLALGMTSPLALHPTRLMLSAEAGSDAFIGVWNLWWTRTAVARGMNPLEGSWLFHPNGTTLALHGFTPAYDTLFLPVLWLVDRLPLAPPLDLFVTFNAIQIASFTLTAYFTFRLALAESGHRGAALLAAVIFAFSSLRFENMVRLHVLSSEFFVLATWAWVTFLRYPSSWRLFLGAVAGLLCAHACLEYAAYAVLLFGLLAVPTLASRPWRQVRAPFAPACLAALAATVALSLPLGIPLVARLREGGIMFDPREVRIYSADLLDLLVPNPRHPLWGGAGTRLAAVWHQGNAHLGLGAGWLALALFATGVGAVRGRGQGRWAWGAVIFWLFALGPELHAAGQAYAVPLPFALLARVPVVGGTRTPMWYMMPAELCLAVAVAVGWGARPRAGRWEGILLGLLLLESLAAPLPLSAIQVPHIYARIDAAPGSSALIHLPRLASREELLYQTIHQQRTVQDLGRAIPFRSRHRGPDPFASREWRTLTQELGSVRRLAGLREPERTSMIGALRQFLRRYQIRWVVVTREAAIPAAHDPRLLGPPLSEAEYGAWRENLRQLGPIDETEVGNATLFEFEAPPIGTDSPTSVRSGSR